MTLNQIKVDDNIYDILFTGSQQNTLSQMITKYEAGELGSTVNRPSYGPGAESGSNLSEYLQISSKGNLTLSSPKKLNFEPANATGDITFKPGDDIMFEAHHRAEGKQNEISMKFTDGLDAEAPVMVQASMKKLVLQKKNGADEVFDLEVNSNPSGSRGYLKVRARAIDLRCDGAGIHGGIAIQPKGSDSNGVHNKIKFEHGGGDGLEFATFNDQKTSIFTDEYRFNKHGLVRMATREKIDSDKVEIEDETTAYKYVKQNDDFYDKLNDTNGATYEGASEANKDVVTTWESIIETSNALNNKEAGSKTQITSKGNVEIKTFTPEGTAVTPNINLTSVGKINLESTNGIYLGGDIEFGSAVELGETDKGFRFINKMTGKGKYKNCDVLQVVATNTHATNNLIWNYDRGSDAGTADAGIPNINNAATPALGGTWLYGGVTLAPGEKMIVGQIRLIDIINFIAWAKYNNFGPWSVDLVGNGHLLALMETVVPEEFNG